MAATATPGAFGLVLRWRRQGLAPTASKLRLLASLTAPQPDAQSTHYVQGVVWLWLHEHEGRQPAAQGQALRALAGQLGLNGGMAHTPYVRFVEQVAARATATELGTSPLQHAAGLALPLGLWLEFGVWKGRSLQLLAEAAPEATTVYGFDSFRGLPTAWMPGFEAGAFDVQGQLPAVGANVQLVVGWFADTLPAFLAQHAGPVALVHVDCDVYESALLVLTLLGPRLQRGCVLVFDELLAYEGFEAHELRAWYEVAGALGLHYTWLGVRHRGCMDVALRIVDPSPTCTLPCVGACGTETQAGGH